MSDPKVVKRKRASGASDAQVQANRANRLKSTGPTSPEGKAKSSQNAMSHGFLSRKVVLEGENPQKFDQLRRCLFADGVGKSFAALPVLGDGGRDTRILTSDP